MACPDQKPEPSKMAKPTHRSCPSPILVPVVGTTPLVGSIHRSHGAVCQARTNRYCNMRQHRLIAACVAAIVALSSISASASSMRCGQRLVTTGDLTADVRRKCGEPDEKVVTPPAVRPDGYPREGAVTVETWIYGPSHGVLRYLRFIDRTLVDIQMRRESL